MYCVPLFQMNSAIVGCGWLGLPVALELISQGHTVYGSTTTESKLEKLQLKGINPFLYNGNFNTGIPEVVSMVDCIIINFPPSKTTNYAQQISSLLSQLNGKCKVIFTSSTGVYEDTDGWKDESSPVIPTHPVFLAEEIIRKSEKQYVILRLAGLIGPDRHPVKYLSGKTLPDGAMVVNLIHRDDVIEAILKLLQGNYWGSTYNVCANDHPTRKEFYTHAALQQDLHPPVFMPSVRTGKCITGKRLENDLEITYRHLDLIH